MEEDPKTILTQGSSDNADDTEAGCQASAIGQRRPVRSGSTRAFRLGDFPVPLPTCMEDHSKFDSLPHYGGHGRPFSG